MRFFIVDAFTDTLFGGNPAGVVIIEGNADFPPEETMQKTAAELRYSETAFIKKIGENSFHTRYFTPEAEVDLCGHATIGTFFALLKAGMAKAGMNCWNKTLAGDLNISISEDSIMMDMGTPEALGKVETESALSKLYGVMGISYDKRHTAAKSGDKEITFMPELISTGLPDIMLPVADETALAAIKPDFPALAALSKEYEVVGVHAFTVNAKDGNAHCRNFAPLYAIDEEAATGTANGALTYYLYKNGWIKDDAKTVFIQGEAMERPSQISSELTAIPDGAVSIRIGGKAAILAEGQLYI